MKKKERKKLQSRGKSTLTYTTKVSKQKPNSFGVRTLQVSKYLIWQRQHMKENENVFLHRGGVQQDSTW